MKARARGIRCQQPAHSRLAGLNPHEVVLIHAVGRGADAADGLVEPVLVAQLEAALLGGVLPVLLGLDAIGVGVLLARLERREPDLVERPLRGAHVATVSRRDPRDDQPVQSADDVVPVHGAIVSETGLVRYS